MQISSDAIFALNVRESPRNTMVTSDFRPEMKIRSFRACAMKNTQCNPYLCPNGRNLRVLEEIGVEEHDMVKLDFKPEVVIWPLCTCAMHPAIIICPIAIAYSMGQIIKSVCVCVSVCLSVCEHSHGGISWSIFTKIGTNVRTPKSKNEFIWGEYRNTLSPILPPKPSF